MREAIAFSFKVGEVAYSSIPVSRDGHDTSMAETETRPRR